MGIVEEFLGLNYRQVTTGHYKLLLMLYQGTEPHFMCCHRGNRGSEKVIVFGIQPFLCRNHTNSQSKDKSFIYGHSTAYQRIESWCSQLFKSMTSSWIPFFKDMVANGLFDINLNFHLQCLHFCFFGVLRHKLTRLNLFGIVIAFVILEIQLAKAVIQMCFISHLKVQE